MMMRQRVWCAAGLAGMLGTMVVLAWAQESRLPTADEIRQVQARYQAEREVLVKSGTARRFLPTLLTKAEEIAQRGAAALASGRLLQAHEAYRQARWQLPYQSPQVPEHVSRILGNLRLRHGMEINAVAFSLDGQRLATASRDRTVKVWDLGNGHELLTYTGHRDEVRQLAFSPDGKVLASAGREASIRLWDPATGKDQLTIPIKGTEKDPYVKALAFNPDGKVVVVGTSDRALRLYETAKGDLKREVTDFQNAVTSVAFNVDGSLLAVGSADGQVRLFEYPRIVDQPDQPGYWSQQDQAGATYQVAFSPDNRTLARCGADGIKLYNIPLPGASFQISAPRRLIAAPSPENRFNCVVFSKDSKTVFTGCIDGLVRLWDAESGQPAGTFKGHNGEVTSLVFNALGNQLASASADYTVRLWDFDIVAQARDFAGHGGSVWMAAFSPDGQRLISASADRTVKVWDVASGKVVHNLSEHQAPVTVALFSPDGKTFLTGGGDKMLRLFDTNTGKLLQAFPGHQGTITAIDFSPDSQKIVSGSADRTIKVWDRGGKLLSNLGEARSVVTAVAFSPEGKQVASGHVDQMIRLWDVATGKLQYAWAAHGIAVSGLAYSPNGQLLASCGADQLVRVWPLASPGASPITVSGHNGPLTGVAFHKDNQHLVSCGSDQVVKLWKLESDGAKEAQNYRGHKDWVTSVAFSRDGFYVASASVDRTVKIWEITSREITLAAEHTGAVEAVALSPDGKLIASGAADKTIKLWDRASGTELMTLAGHSDGLAALAFFPDGKTLLSSGYDRCLKLWDVATGQERPRSETQQQNWSGYLDRLPLVAVAADGQQLMTYEPGNERHVKIRTYDLAGNELVTITDGNRHVQAVAFSADGKTAATGAKDGSVRLFDLAKKGQLFPGGDWFLFDKGAGVSSLAFTPKADALVVGSDQGDIKVCRLPGKETLHILKPFAQRISTCTVSPDGKLFAAFSVNNVLKLFDLGSGKELRSWDMRMPLQERGAFVTNMAFTPDSRQLVTANANTTLYVLDLP